MKLQKVIYSITKLGRTENTKLTGIGYITDEDLLIATEGRNHKSYIRAFECIKDMKQDIKNIDEFKGGYFEMFEIDGRDVTVNYMIWYKLIK